MSFDLYAPAEPPRRPPMLPRLLWNPGKDGRYYADVWGDNPFREIWLHDRELCQSIGIEPVLACTYFRVSWAPMTAPPRQVSEVSKLLIERNAVYIAEVEARVAGRISRNNRAEGAEARGEATIAKHGVGFSRCRSIKKNLDELKKWIPSNRARSLRLEIDRLCDAVEAAAAKKAAAKQSIEDKKAQLAAALADRRAP